MAALDSLFEIIIIVLAVVLVWPLQMSLEIKLTVVFAFFFRILYATYNLDALTRLTILQRCCVCAHPCHACSSLLYILGPRPGYNGQPYMATSRTRLLFNISHNPNPQVLHSRIRKGHGMGSVLFEIAHKSTHVRKRKLPDAVVSGHKQRHQIRGSQRWPGA